MVGLHSNSSPGNVFGNSISLDRIHIRIHVLQRYITVSRLRKVHSRYKSTACIHNMKYMSNGILFTILKNAMLMSNNLR